MRMKNLYSVIQSQKENLVAIALFFVLIIGLFDKMADGSHEFISGDSLSPKAVAQGMELAKAQNGEYPLWLPWMFSGLPSVHSFQYISRYYFPHQAFLWLKTLGMPWIWVFFIHYVFAGFGGFLLLKRLKLDQLSAFLGAVAFMITPYMITMLVFGHGSQMMTAAYIPWIFWGLLKLDENPTLLASGILSLLMGLQLLRGHVQIAYYTWLMLGIYLIFRGIQLIRAKDFTRLKFIGYTAFSMLVAGGLSMSIYYPVSQYTPFSIRGADGGGAAFEYATQWSFSFPEMMTFLVPSFFGFGGGTYWGTMPHTDYPNYMGILILLFAVYGAFFNRNNFKYVLLFTILISLLLSFGKHLFLYQLFYDHFPYFNKFRVPVMFLVLTQFSVAGLSALGFHSLQQKLAESRFYKEFRYSVYIWVGISVILLIIGKGLLSWFAVPDHVKPMIRTDIFTLMVLTGLTLGILYITMKKWVKPPVASTIIALIAILDLIMVDRKIIDPAPDSGRSAPYQTSRYIRSYLREDDVIKFLEKDHSQFRILPLQYLMNENRWSAFHIESVMGYHPAKLAIYNDVITKVGFESAALLRMLNVKYLVHLQQISHPDFKEAFKGNYYIQGQYIPAYVYEYSGQLQRVFFARSIRMIEDPNAQMAELKKPNFDPVTDAFVSSTVDETSFTAGGRVDIATYTPDYIELNTVSQTDQFLIFSEIYYPKGWTASIDGDPIKVYETNAILRGISVPAGNHTVTMSFQPEDIRIGNLISHISFLLIAGVIVIGVWMQKRKSSQILSP